MRKSCVKPVYTLGKTPKVAHIMYSFFHCRFGNFGALPHQNPQRPQVTPPAFPTAISFDFNLLVSKLSPLYTAPITNTTNVYK